MRFLLEIAEPLPHVNSTHLSFIVLLSQLIQTLLSRSCGAGAERDDCASSFNTEFTLREVFSEVVITLVASPKDPYFLGN